MPSPASRLAFAAAATLAWAPHAFAQSTVGVSTHVGGSLAEGETPVLSRDGRYVAFMSVDPTLDPTRSPNFVTGYACFRVDTRTGATRGVSIGPTTNELRSGMYPSLSGDGRWVAFDSLRALELLAPVDARQVGLRDFETNTTSLVSVALGGGPGNGDSTHGRITPNGRFVAFHSFASNLVAGDTNGLGDVFVFDAQSGTCVRASVGQGGVESPTGAAQRFAISDDGRFVLFESTASNLAPPDTNNAADAFVRDLVNGTTVRVSVRSGGLQLALGGNADDLSSDGTKALFQTNDATLAPGDTNGLSDVFVYDLVANTTEVVSASTLGVPLGAAGLHARFSGDGRQAVFSTTAPGVVPGDGATTTDVFLRDIATRTTRAASFDTQGRIGQFGGAAFASPSADAARVVFQAFAPVSGGEAVYLADLSIVAHFGDGKLNSGGCITRIGALGTPSASAGSGFQVVARNVRNQQAGVLLYSTTGIASTPFGGGTLLLAPDLRRTGVKNSGGSALPAIDCTGAWSLDFNAWIASGVDAALVPGARVWMQYVGRDSGFTPPNDATLSDGLSITLQP